MILCLFSECWRCCENIMWLWWRLKRLTDESAKVICSFSGFIWTEIKHQCEIWEFLFSSVNRRNFPTFRGHVIVIFRENIPQYLCRTLISDEFTFTNGYILFTFFSFFQIFHWEREKKMNFWFFSFLTYDENVLASPQFPLSSRDFLEIFRFSSHFRVGLEIWE